MQNYEGLGEFYLGKVVDEETMQTVDQYYLLDSKDLNTHAVIVGMTGSGKTGLAIGLLEEAVMDNIPAIVIDPKGDMSNLLLSFPDFKAEDFAPWIDPAEAAQAGQSPEEFAAKVANDWKTGLESSDITADRVREYKEKSIINVYTPGSSAGKQLSILDLADLPSEAVLNDSESLNDYVSSTVSSLLSLLKIDADPLTSREHILLSNVLLNKWNNRENVSLASLIQSIQQPGIDTIGVLPLENFFPQADRNKLAMQFNNLLASPSFNTWLQGEELNIQNLLYTKDAKAKISVISLNHLSEEDRVFIVSIILNKIVSWTRAQTGTSSLRAMLYMDEIFGYFPPVSNPPTKKPLLTLLKQARAYGLSVVLATQNPVDLDYKGLSNIGTWFIGRLQTEQDKNRLLDGLKSADNADAVLNAGQINDLISNLPKRTFLVNNVHEDGPELFTTRWAMSYLTGPMTRKQIELVSKDQKVVEAPVEKEIGMGSVAGTNEAAVAPAQAVNPWESTGVVSSVGQEEETAPVQNTSIGTLPDIPSNIDQYYMPSNRASGNLAYLPSLYAIVDTLFEDKKHNIASRVSTIWNTPINEGIIAVDWANTSGAKPEADELTTESEAMRFLNVPQSTNRKGNYTQWQKDLVDYLYKEQELVLMENTVNGMVSNIDEERQEFILRVEQALRETRDQDIADLKDDYKNKIARAQEKVRKAEARVEREAGQAKQAKMNTFIDLGSTILDSFLGRKKFGKSTVSKAARSARSAGRATQQGTDVERAQADLDTYQEDLNRLEAELERDLNALSDSYATAGKNISDFTVTPLKKNINVRAFALLWLPFEEGADGSLSALYDIEK